MNNKFIETVKEENRELDELENSNASEDVKKIKLDSLEFKYRYALYLALNDNEKK